MNMLRGKKGTAECTSAVRASPALIPGLLTGTFLVARVTNCVSGRDDVPFPPGAYCHSKLARQPHGALNAKMVVAANQRATSGSGGLMG